jgi:hypothetical protein
MSPSAWTRGHERALFSTLHYLDYLERTGTPVLNGRDAYLVELSKVRQSSPSLQALESSTPARV